MGRRGAGRLAVGFWVVWVIWVNALGCAHSQPLPPVPGKGGPAWTAIESEDFVLWTDLDEQSGAALLAKLEDFREVLLGSLFAGAPTPRKKGLVVAFARAVDWDAFGPTLGSGFFMRPSRAAYNVPALFLPSEAMKIDEYDLRDRGPLPYELHTDPAEVRQHELTHMMMEALIRDAPPWLDEGMASYFETAKLDPTSGMLIVGGLPADLQARLKHVELSRISTILGFTIHNREVFGLHDTGFHLTCHLFVSFLFNEHADLLARYLSALRAAPVEKRDDVWDEVFADHPTYRLESDFRSWLKAGRARTILVPVAHVETAATVTGPVPDADVYWFRALLYAALGSNGSQFRGNLSACVAADPTHVGCNLYRSAMDRDLPIDGYAIAAAHADDWRAWLLAARSAGRRNDAEALRNDMQHVCALVKEQEPIGGLAQTCKELESPSRP